MHLDLDREHSELAGHQVTWFAPERPVEGQTIFIKPVDGPDEQPSPDA